MLTSSVSDRCPTYVLVLSLIKILGNWLGNLAWTTELEWPGHKDFKAAPLQDLNLLADKKTKIGSVKSSGNFTFMRLSAGGHMVPHDQPVASLDMVNRWIGGEWMKQA